MQGLQRSTHWGCYLAVGGLAVFLACTSVQAATNPGRSVAIADRVELDVSLVSSKRGLETGPWEIHQPGASFIKLHFSDFMLPEGVGVVVSSPDDSERYFYSRGKRDAFTWDAKQGDDGRTRFSAMSISGDTAMVRIVGQVHDLRPGRYRVQLDHFLSGHRRDESSVPPNRLDVAPGESPSKPQTSCGINERYDAVCWKDSHRPEYETAFAIATLVTATGEECTAWRVGSDNRMFTAQHCVGSQDDVSGSEIWFNYRATTCGGSTTGTVVKVTGDQFLTADAGLDYGLFSVNDFSSITQFGYLGLEVREGSPGEGIFIPQHGLGRPAQIALESDMNASGWCEVDDIDQRTGKDIGYFCDTTTSSSGSPVITASSGKVIALHHLGGCMNSGTKMKLIWPQVSSYFGGSIPNSDTAWTGGGWGGGGDEVNILPDAAFTADCDGLSCTFDGGVSDDPDGQIATWTWSLGDGASDNGPTVSQTYAEGGTYTVTLTVTDDAGGEDSLSSSVSVVAPNASPNANFSVRCSAEQCTFDAGSSADDDGSISDYSWTLGDGGSANDPVVQHTYASAGTYSVNLTVTDDDGATGKRSRSVSITLPNEAPAADFSYNCNERTCEFNGGASADSDGSITAYSWSFGDGGNANGPVMQHTFASAGTYSVNLTVTDDDGATGNRSRSVSITLSNEAPVAGFSYSCNELDCEFNGGASTDSDGSITAYSWSFGDGQSAQGVTVAHAFTAAGDYVVRLTVTDDSGATAARSRTLSPAAQSENVPPRADFTVSCSLGHCGFDGRASQDPDGQIASYAWNFGDGRTASGSQPVHEFAKAGTYEITLTVTDDLGMADSQSRTIEVGKLPITLHVDNSGAGAKTLVVLKWSGAESLSVDLYRDGKLLSRIPNNGLHIDKLRTKKSIKKLSYRLCEQDSDFCSSEVGLQ